MHAKPYGRVVCFAIIVVCVVFTMINNTLHIAVVNYTNLTDAYARRITDYMQSIRKQFEIIILLSLKGLCFNMIEVNRRR
jgi:hypothetical protein